MGGAEGSCVGLPLGPTGAPPKGPTPQLVLRSRVLAYSEANVFRQMPLNLCVRRVKNRKDFVGAVSWPTYLLCRIGFRNRVSQK